MKYKHPEIDLLKMAKEFTDREWNHLLRKCTKARDLDRLSGILYGLQRGMDSLVKMNLNTPKMNELFCKWTRDVETCAKYIFRTRHPTLLDSGLGSDLNNVELSTVSKEIKNKKMRDTAFQKFLQESRF